jgi:hypothetical protein
MSFSNRIWEGKPAGGMDPAGANGRDTPQSNVVWVKKVEYCRFARPKVVEPPEISGKPDS